MKSDNVIVEQMYPYITKRLSDHKVRKKIMLHVGEFLDRNSKSLMVTVPIEKMYITDTDRKFFYDLLDVDPKEIKLMIKKISFITSSWKALSGNDFIFILLNVIRYLHLNGHKNETTAMNLYLIVHDFAIYFLQYFRYIQVQTMEYTINNLNNKHDLKKYGTVYNVLVKKITKYYSGYAKLLESEDDKDLVDYLGNLNTRVKGWMKVLMLEYKKNKDSGKYFIAETDNYEEGSYKETSNRMMDLESLVDKTTKKLFSYTINMRLVSTVSSITKVSKSTLTSTLTGLRRKGDIAKVKTIIRNILIIYLIDNNKNVNDIYSTEFLNTILLIFNRSNTSNKHIVEIKTTLDEILIEFNKKYSATNREATRINWRKSIYLYIAMNIQLN